MNSVRVNDWTAELAIIANDANKLPCVVPNRLFLALLFAMTFPNGFDKVVKNFHCIFFYKNLDLLLKTCNMWRVLMRFVLQ